MCERFEEEMKEFDKFFWDRLVSPPDSKEFQITKEMFGGLGFFCGRYSQE